MALMSANLYVVLKSSLFFNIFSEYATEYAPCMIIDIDKTTSNPSAQCTMVFDAQYTYS